MACQALDIHPGRACLCHVNVSARRQDRLAQQSAFSCSAAPRRYYVIVAWIWAFMFYLGAFSPLHPPRQLPMYTLMHCTAEDPTGSAQVVLRCTLPRHSFPTYMLYLARLGPAEVADGLHWQRGRRARPLLLPQEDSQGLPSYPFCAYTCMLPPRLKTIAPFAVRLHGA